MPVWAEISTQVFLIGGKNMGEQDNVLAFKNLAVAIIGGDLTAETVPGETIADIVNYIAENYPTA